MYNRAKQRAKEKNLEFNINISDIIIPEFCPALGVPLIRAKGKPDNNSPTLDRIDNSKGYVKGNIQVISHRANTLKSNGSLHELKKITQYMEERNGIG